MTEARTLVDARLESWADRMAGEVPGRLGEALAYALRSPGKRVRPALVLGAARAVGGEVEAVLEVATAVEIVHTYSLVHDDLPCMDDDALRRGRPTTHCAFDVPTATRVGFLLVPVAAQALAEAAESLQLDSEARRALGHELFEAGASGGWWAVSGFIWRPKASNWTSRASWRYTEGRPVR